MSYNAAVQQRVKDRIKDSIMAPCKGCSDRVPACHDKCDKYKEWHDSIVEKQRAFVKKYKNDYCGEADDKRRCYRVSVINKANRQSLSKLTGYEQRVRKSNSKY